MFAYTVYFNPKDYPNKYIVRKFEVLSQKEPLPREVIYEGKSLYQARRAIPCNCICFKRHNDDEKPIVETWI